MNQLLSIACIAFAIFIQSYESTELEPQIKVVDTHTWYYNKKYVDALTYTVTRGNKTYNHISLHWDLVRNLPKDLKLVSKVYVTDSSYRNKNLFLVDETPVCRKSNHRQFLPKVLIVDESQLNGECIKKRVYNLKDMGQLRFEHLVPDIHAQGDYYQVDYTLGTDSEVVLIATFYCEWGYLKDY